MIFNSVLKFTTRSIIKIIKKKVLSHFLVLFILSKFLLYRIPRTFDVFFFSSYLIIVLLPYFMSLVSRRIIKNWEEFFARFTPIGAPIGIAPFVSIAEGISYIVRPFVLILRPFLNLTIGAFGALSVGRYLRTSLSPVVILLFTFLFFYEIFVRVVHWFIVRNIIIFSIDH